MIEYLIKKDGNLQKLISNIPNKKISVFGCGENERLAIIDSLDSFVMYIVSNISDAIKVNDILNEMGKSSIIFNPDFNYNLSTIYDYTNINIILNKILFKDLDAIVVPCTSLLVKLPNPEVYLDNIKLKVGSSYKLEDVVDKLISIGYKKVDQIESIGEFRIFGDVLDIKPITEELTYRINFFDEEIESIYSVDMHYSKVNIVDSLEILPNKFVSNLDLELIKHEVAKQKSKGLDNDQINSLNNILDMVALNTLNPFMHVFDKTINYSIFDYLPKYSTIVIDDAKLIYDTMSQELKEDSDYVNSLLNECKMLPSHLNTYFAMSNIIGSIAKLDSVLAFQMLTSANRFFNPQMVFNIKTIPTGNYVNKSQVLVNDIRNYLVTQNTVLLFVKGKEYIEQFETILNSNRVSFVEATNYRNIIKNTVNIIPLSYNLSFGFKEESLVVIGSNSLFGNRKPKVKNIKAVETIEEYIPEPNDYVVHEIHGIGRYIGIENLHLHNNQKDYLVIEYKNKDRLYLPVEYTNRLTKYVGGDVPTLNKLGGVEFANIKSKVKNSLKELAFSLIELYKARSEAKGFKYITDTELEEAFKSSFMYEETPDQEKAINDVLSDMEQGKVMDRLICGDVGYGKTEVALRAIFKTVICDKQCMFMCPTTVLSEQHFNTCVNRLQEFGIKVAVLNRFKSKAETKKILQDLKSGDIDVICGTHRLLSADVEFKDLGLLVLDEEQKFGVGDKEKIKNIKKNVNVLTLSATPIPRTLHMSMIGVRDISVINTPPTNRLNVATTVTEFSSELLKNAISKEIERGGQVLVIYNRIDGIYSIASSINEMFNNELIIDVAHGQMTEEMLEDATYRLYSGKTQVLVATTIIENGVDLPKANTLFVIDADNLGLSQLYQLKGRVGRNDIQAYAYFTYNNYKVLNIDAYKRLEAIVKYSEMGSGYKIAMRDLEIRGAGNILGPEQHGHMAKVGYAMYVNLLNQAIDEVKQNKTDLSLDVDTKIETTLQAYMPEDYITDEKSKIVIYNKISSVKSSNEMIDLCIELKNEFGDLPMELVNLIKVSLIKNLSTRLKADKVVINQSSANIMFNSNKCANDKKINEALSIYKNNVVLNLINMPIIEFRNVTSKNVLDIVIDFLTFVLD